jgi:hypothetical protein
MINTEIKKVSAPGRKGKVNRGNFKGESLIGGIDYQIEGGYALPADDEYTAASTDLGTQVPSMTASFQPNEPEENVFADARSEQYSTDRHFTEKTELFGEPIAPQPEWSSSYAEEQPSIETEPQQQHQDDDQYQRDAYVNFLSEAARETPAPAPPVFEEYSEQPAEHEIAPPVERQQEKAADLADIIAAEKARRAAARAEEERLEREAAEAEAAAEAELRNRRMAEAAVLAQSAASEESDALLSQRRAAEEQRRKREMFLASMDTFAQSAAEYSQQTSTASRQGLFGDDDALTGQFRHIADQHVANTSRTTVPNLFAPPVEEPYRPAAHADIGDVPRNSGLFQQDDRNDSNAPISLVSRGDANNFAQLTSSLFAANNSAADAQLFGAVPQREPEANPWGAPETATVDYSNQGQSSNESPLRLPTGIGARRGSGPTSAPQQVTFAEVEEEEGTGAAESISNILTIEQRRALSPQQAAAWKALQADLSTRRQDFHGAVTYAFEGIFSWQMYGSAEAIEEGGLKYTEYLMRCQWGTNWENLQPWIVARRFREFENLNYQLRRGFPSQAHNIPKLPEKDFFRNLDAAVVDRRRRLLEEYMVRIVQSLPTIVHSPYFDDFLGITERIKTIKQVLGPEALISAVPPPQQHQQQQQQPPQQQQPNYSHPPSAPHPPTPSYEEQYQYQRPPQYHQPTYPASQPYHQEFHQPPPPQYAQQRDVNMDRGVVTGIPQEESVATDYWETGAGADDLGITSPEAAERERELRGNEIHPMDDMELGRLEEDIRELRFVLHGNDPTRITQPGQSRTLLRSCTERWPALRATATFGVHGQVDFTIIPRAMQAEEDLMRIIDDYRSLLLAVSMG